jgi:ABC-type glycerol-3-phosphate transport system substrate-binding protein
MYWNRDTFNSAGIAKYPTTWEEFTGSGLKPGLVQKLTTKDQNGNVRKSAIALGDFTNITNAREIMGSLLLQIGNPVTTLDDQGYVVSAIQPYSSSKPSYAFSFFSQFANPTNLNYSWNRGLPNDKTSFLSGNLATYFGFASELSDLRNKNANLNFDVAPLPQFAQTGERGGIKSLYAKMYGFSLVKNSAKLDGSYQVISILTNKDNMKILSDKMYNASILRDIIAQGSTDQYVTIFNQSALIAKTWLDVDVKQSNKIFGDLIQNIISGKKALDQAVKDAHDIYDVTLKQVQ